MNAWIFVYEDEIEDKTSYMKRRKKRRGILSLFLPSNSKFVDRVDP